MPLTIEEKRELFRQDRYSFPPPPVCHVRWDSDAWIRYIDSVGRWHVQGPVTDPQVLEHVRKQQAACGRGCCE